MLEVASQMASAMDCYEDMFKEITRKLYGEEEDVDFEAEGFKSVEHLTAAFGLATRSHLKSETPQVQQPKSSPASEQETSNPPPTNTSSVSKRYNCAHCPYATDRRDLFTRHENIHREDKPFQCYVCMKQFNRADHVKKHFLRMHREHTYDLNRIRKQPPKNASGMSFYQKYNESQPPNNVASTLQNHQQQINIPSGIVNPMVRTNQAPMDVVKQQPKTIPNKSTTTTPKKKGEKKFSCCYCTWTGVDNWCLKRHLNTHLKPFVCMLCDYKAARSERLTTHILKVHNKRACTRCNYLADDQAALTIHLQENHPLDHRNNKNHNRSNQNNSTANAASSLVNLGSNFGQLDSMKSCSKNETQRSEKHKRQPHGADRLFSYLEASDHESNHEDDTSKMSNPSRPFVLEKTTNPPIQAAPPLPFKQDPKKMGDFSKMFFNNQFLGESSKYIPDPNIMKNMQVNYFSEQNLVFNKFLDEEKNLYYQNLPDSKNMFLNHPNFGAPTPNPFFNPQYIQDKAKMMGHHPSVSDVTKMYKHPDFFRAGNVETKDDCDVELPLFICSACGCQFIDDSSLEYHNIVNHKENSVVINCHTFPAKKERKTNSNNVKSKKIIKRRIYVTKKFVNKLCRKFNKLKNIKMKKRRYTCNICTTNLCKKYQNRFQNNNISQEDIDGKNLSDSDKYNNNNFIKEPKHNSNEYNEGIDDSISDNSYFKNGNILKNKYMHKILKIQKCIFCHAHHTVKSFWNKMSLFQHNSHFHKNVKQCNIKQCPVNIQQ